MRSVQLKNTSRSTVGQQTRIERIGMTRRSISFLNNNARRENQGSKLTNIFSSTNFLWQVSILFDFGRGFGRLCP